MSLSTEAKVGSVVVSGLILLAFIVVNLGGFTFGDQGYPVQAVFSQVNGLREGNLVRYAGVEVGRVKAVEVVPEGVSVTLLIQPHVKIPLGSRFSIGTDGLLGEKFIHITPPEKNTGYIEPNSVIKGEQPGGIDHMIATADRVLADVEKLIKSLNEVIGDEKVKASMKETAVNAREITKNLNAMSEALARMAVNNEDNINAMAVNLRAMSGSLRDVTSRVDKLVESVDNNGQTAKDLAATIQNLRQTSARIEKMAGSLEGVVTDPETAANIKETLRNARDATAKANKMLTQIDNIDTTASFEMLYNSDSDTYRSNANLKINSSPDRFAVIGVTDIGEDSKTNLQVGKNMGRFSARAGVVEDKAGVGVDAAISDQMKVSVDVYDPNDIRVKLRTQYQIAPETYLVGQTDSINRDPEKHTYFGVSKSF